MRPATLCLVITLVAGTAARAQPPADPLSRARQLYNAGDFEGTIVMAAEASKRPAWAAAASLVQGRAHLERYRRSANDSDLLAARTLLKSIDSSALPPRERVELTVGLAQTLFLEDQFGAAAEMFAAVSGLESDPLGHDRVLDWWAASLDRYALSRPAADRATIYAPLITRLEDDLRRLPGSAPAVYWLAAAARGSGEMDRAWNLAIAGWVRAPLTGARAVALRTDLDRLMAQGIIPERVKRAASQAPRTGTPPVTIESLTAEWERLKEKWK